MKGAITILSILVLALLSGCEKFEGLPYKKYTIKAGNHTSNHGVQTLSRHFLVFDVIFDESAIYQTRNPANQLDVNKLFGFADCNAFHHDQSIRFGWRWDPDAKMVEILVYAYVNSQRIIEPLTFVELNESNRYEIILREDSYYLRVGKDKFILNRGADCTVGEYYLLWPFFGGDETAPHDIHIYMRRHIRSISED